MDTRFDFAAREKEIYKLWEKNKAFTPQGSGRPFCIILPPPNANADLHVGHAAYVIEDIMIRYHRMKGDTTLWLPGADHAGFETQFVFEKNLAKEGKSRFDYTSQEDLWTDIWNFVQANRGIMEDQIRRLGFSVDWNRKKFTLDPDIQKIVYATFKKLYDAGLIYRGERLVNYCTKCGTSFSDLEVKHEETVGKLYFVNYNLADGSGKITVATTRPETMFADVAVAVNPNDQRYKSLIGKKAIIPLVSQEILIIADDYAKMEFGTGAVKITPSHDENDFEVWQRHKNQLPSPKPIISFAGKMMDGVPVEIQNLPVAAAREKLLEILAAQEFLIKTEDHNLVLGKCYKCGRILEPLPLPQWFIKIKPLAEPAVAAIKNGEIKFHPDFKKDQAIDWLNNFHDWNVSRQIVWGIRIPAWQCQDCQNWIITAGEKPEKCSSCSSSHLVQDTDTFDTWFSSGQWPFATLIATDSFEHFYPTSVMETGYDILPWWVCRMIMLGIFATGKIPFHHVYLHGLVRDGKGQKMSKSRGNVINPLTVADQYGADALRAALVFGIGQGADIPFSVDKAKAMRNFTTKIWNIGRFLANQIEEVNPAGGDNQLEPSADSKQLLQSANNLIFSVTSCFENFDFSQAFNQIYDFVWHKLADYFLENYKSLSLPSRQKQLPLFLSVFSAVLKLLHPFMPFVTEELWQTLKLNQNSSLLITSPWPKKIEE